MFVDKAIVRISGGDGGNGIVSFRREKFIEKGGPDGGDGGEGGDVIFVGSNDQNTLATFRYQKELKAESGKAGAKRKMHGRSGKDLIVKVPVGTVINDEDGKIIADITENNQKIVVAKGGKGGFGNAHFISSRRRSPRIAEKGEPGEEFTAGLELKMIADAGLIGLPNAGKSTLLSKLTNAKPEIADYPFTTLHPNLGVADLDKSNSILLADIPGLIEGASNGKGLGDDFLRHIERTRVLVHLIDSLEKDIAEAYKIIRRELTAYKVDLSSRPEIVAVNKIDSIDKKELTKRLSKLKILLPPATPLLLISAADGQGTKELLYEIMKKIKAAEKKMKTREEPSIPVITLPETADSWSVEKNDNAFLVKGPKIEKFARRTDFDTIGGRERLRDILRKMGIMHELERRDIKPGEEIMIGGSNEHKLKY